MKVASLLVISLLSTFGSAKVNVGRERKLESDGIGFEAQKPREELQVMGELAINPYQDAFVAKLANIINGEDYECETEATALTQYYGEVYAPLTYYDYDALNFLFEYDVQNWPYWAVLLYGSIPATDGGEPMTEVFYPNDQQGIEYRERMTALQGFWDTYTDDLSLYSMSGLFIANTPVMVTMLQVIYGYSQANAEALTGYTQWIIESYAPNVGYDFPLWSFNAFAAPSFEDYPILKGGSSIVMGDGLRMFLESAETDDSGPDFIFFHEFAHQVQFGNNIDFGNSPEDTRRAELMADALAAYFGHSPSGASFSTERVQEISETAYAVGDCGFDSPGHHGTPNQRAKAVQFAVNLIDESEDKTQILSSADFIAIFDAELEDILASDIPYRMCENFAVHARTTVTFAGVVTTIHGGDMGVSPGTSITGAFTLLNDGEVVDDSSVFAASVLTAHTASMAVQPEWSPMDIEIGGKTFTPGTYRSGSAINFAFGTVVTLDGLNDPNPVFLFQAGSTLVTAADTYFILKNGAKAEHIYWALGSAATLGARSVVEGSILAGTAITFGSKSILHGCALAQSAVTFESEGSIDLVRG